MTRNVLGVFLRRLCTSSETLFEASDDVTLSQIVPFFKVRLDFVTEKEEALLLEEIEPHIKRLRYEKSHWDGAIVGYREVERKNWSKESQTVGARFRSKGVKLSDRWRRRGRRLG